MMAEALHLEEQFAIITESERPSIPIRVLKHGETFAVFDQRGDIVADASGELGVFHEGTRFLSRLELLLDSRHPVLLSSRVSDDNTMFTADLTNSDIREGDRVVLPRGTLHLYRSRVLWNGGCADLVRIANHGLEPVQIPLVLRFDSDFADIFEVRGTRRAERGHFVDREDGDLVLSYQGLDHVERRTRVHTFPSDFRVGRRHVSFVISLEPHASRDLEISVVCEIGNGTHPVRRYAAVLQERKDAVAARETRECVVLGSSAMFNQWIRRSSADLRMMITETPHGLYPYAGIPWFSTPFGRDGIITAMELLWASPEVARGVLTFLADTQATDVDDARDAQPGKILHEMRGGEMAALGEIPFGRYYGSADATPLFVMLAAQYFERTGDQGTIESLWPHIVAALDWMVEYGDIDGDGFIEYARRSDTGLVQQGWKDSYDSVSHADGSLADAPIALCEIQGYAYAAWLGAARLAVRRGDTAQATAWRERAALLQQRFEDAFWCEELGTYALALDARKQQCRVVSSNAGHCLFTRIASAARAARVSAALMSEQAFSGWGVRTLAAGARRYNPMSYHNGSVWPHDNALIALGLSHYGHTREASRVASAMLDLSRSVDLHRLPELICGFHRRPGEFPTLYPVACAPQAWAAASAFMLLQASLGLHVDALDRRVTFTHARLPESLEWLRIANLTVGDASVDLLITRHAHDVAVTVLRRDGEVEIVTVA